MTKRYVDHACIQLRIVKPSDWGLSYMHDISSGQRNLVVEATVPPQNMLKIAIYLCDAQIGVAWLFCTCRDRTCKGITHRRQSFCPVSLSPHPSRSGVLVRLAQGLELQAREPGINK